MIIQEQDQTSINSFYLSLYEIFDEVSLDDLNEDGKLKTHHDKYLFKDEKLLELYDEIYKIGVIPPEKWILL